MKLPCRNALFLANACLGLRIDDRPDLRGNGALAAAGSSACYARYSLAGWRSAAQDDVVASPEAVLSDLREAFSVALAGRLRGLDLHGSPVAGDFAADRSDLDLLAVLATDPDRSVLDVLARLHVGLDRRHPRWAGRIEVE
jgi:hypothetical protein